PSPRRNGGHTRRPTRRRRLSAAPISNAARFASPSISAARANPTRDSVTGFVEWVARLTSSASSRIVRPSSSRPRISSRTPSHTREMAASQALVEPLRQGPRLARVAEGVLATVDGRFQKGGGEERDRRPVRLILAAELLERLRRPPKGTVEVAGD